jgi:hypothetical protein
VSWKSAIVDNRKAVVQLSDPELRQIMPTLYDLREKAARALTKFLKGEHVASEYSMHKHRALIVQLDDVIKTAERELPTAMLLELRSGSKKATLKGIKKLEAMVNAGDQKFSGAIGSLNLPVARIMLNVERTVMGRYEHKSDRYAGDVGRRIRNELAIGVVRGETVGEMTRRLLGGAEYARRAKRGVTAVAEGMADTVVFKAKHEAERLVRTELVNAYTESQLESLQAAEEEDRGYQKIWDAANDVRTCQLCWSLDEVCIDINDTFKGGFRGPPAHPNDRCCLVPWHRGWGSSKGKL